LRLRMRPRPIPLRPNANRARVPGSGTLRPPGSSQSWSPSGPFMSSGHDVAASRCPASRFTGHLSWAWYTGELAALPLSAAAGILQRTAAIAATLANPAMSGLFVMMVPSMTDSDDMSRRLTNASVARCKGQPTKHTPARDRVGRHANPNSTAPIRVPLATSSAASASVGCLGSDAKRDSGLMKISPRVAAFESSLLQCTPDGRRRGTVRSRQPRLYRTW
jgi:hypothetical protein